LNQQDAVKKVVLGGIGPGQPVGTAAESHESQPYFFIGMLLLKKEGDGFAELWFDDPEVG
jgi:hypothetical protein